MSEGVIHTSQREYRKNMTTAMSKDIIKYLSETTGEKYVASLEELKENEYGVQTNIVRISRKGFLGLKLFNDPICHVSGAIKYYQKFYTNEDGRETLSTIDNKISVQTYDRNIISNSKLEEFVKDKKYADIETDSNFPKVYR